MTAPDLVDLIRRFRRFIACRRLQRMVERTRNSFECERYRRNRAAQISRRFKGEQR